MKNYTYWMLGGASLLLLMSMMKKGSKAVAITIVDGAMRLRGCDAGGCGHFGASRGSRSHKGVDILCLPGAQVFAPFDATVERKSDPYGDGKYSGLQLRMNASEYMKIMYFAPLNGLVGTNVRAGQLLGYAQDIRTRYSTPMQSHLHVEMFVNNVQVDATSYLGLV